MTESDYVVTNARVRSKEVVVRGGAKLLCIVRRPLMESQSRKFSKRIHEPARITHHSLYPPP
ncbi:MAG: hypothetical protein QOH49_421 [Acidobacteriota bacterium]|jgi:hypothetical protein|nr:hypothetical protein [Acidobacteriota bacterium]